ALGEGYFIFVKGGVVSRYANMKHHSEVDIRREAYQSPEIWFRYGLDACRAALDMPVYKYYVYLTDTSHPPAALRAALGGIRGASLTQSGATNIEVTGDEADKGVGVKVLADRLGVAKHQIMAMGDHLNDLAMLRAAGLKVAMGNSEKELKDISDYVTEDNAHDGAGRAIRRFCLGEDVPFLQ
ncbi:MAG TPA: HAD-IIB family hydrolase, partial [Candidatus Limnocylindria bacterium]|nr:HAD-IIB family hydrolase [Candidatus Limnocylindria bacterium]